MKQSKYSEVLELVKNIQEGTVILMSAKKIKGNKISLEFAEKVQGSAGVNITSLLNESDSRFNPSKAVRAYQSAEISDAKKYLSIDLSELKSEVIERNDGTTHEVYPLGIIDPVIVSHPMRIQINEKVGLQTDWERENPNKAIKQNGNGLYLVVDGEPIVRTYSVVTGTPNHTFVQHTDMVQSLDQPVVNTETGEVTTF